MHILITSIKDYNLFLEEYNSKGVTWKSGHKFTDRNAPIYKRVIRHLSFGESVIMKIYPNNRCIWVEESEYIYFNHIIKEGDYILCNSARIVIV